MRPSVGEMVSHPGVSGSREATGSSTGNGNEDWPWEQTGEAVWPQVQKIRVVSDQMRTTTVCTSRSWGLGPFGAMAPAFSERIATGFLCSPGRCAPWRRCAADTPPLALSELRKASFAFLKDRDRDKLANEFAAGAMTQW